MTEATVEPLEKEGEDERRGERRAAITLKVEYKRLNTFFADYTKNISKGGTFIHTTKPLPVGTEFTFVLTAPRAEPRHDPSTPPVAVSASSSEEASNIRLELTGEVKWVIAEAEATPDKPAGMGIEFIFANDAERDHVASFVAALMRSSLGNRIADRLLAKSQL